MTTFRKLDLIFIQHCFQRLCNYMHRYRVGVLNTSIKKFGSNVAVWYFVEG